MLIFGVDIDPFGCQDCRYAAKFEESIACSSEDLAEIVKWYVMEILNLLFDLGEILTEHIRGEIVENHGFVDVFSSSFGVDSFDCMVK